MTDTYAPGQAGHPQKPMKARERLTDALLAIQARDFPRALSQLVWFHDHALEEDVALRGVRLSFALSYWIELGAEFPPALEELRAVRDRKTQALRVKRNPDDVQYFRDVTAINRYLQEQSATYELFKELQGLNPQLAQACQEMVLPAVIEASQFEQAKAIYGDPKVRLQAMVDSLNQDIARASARSDERRELILSAVTANYAQDVQGLLSVFAATDGKAYAAALHTLALEWIAYGECRQRVSEYLPLG